MMGRGISANTFVAIQPLKSGPEGCGKGSQLWVIRLPDRHVRVALVGWLCPAYEQSSRLSPARTSSAAQPAHQRPWRLATASRPAVHTGERPRRDEDHKQ